MSDARSISNPFGRIVEYHVFESDPLPPIRCPAGYDFVLAGNGLFKRGENEFMRATVNVASVSVPYLKPLEESLHLKTGRVPPELLREMLAGARAAAAGDSPREAGFFVEHHRLSGEYRIVRPAWEEAGGASYEYRLSAADCPILEVHSHNDMRAFFSGVDTADEQGFRIYGVLGRVREAPEMTLRLGLYGHYMALTPSEVFDGDVSFVEAVEPRVDFTFFVTLPGGGPPQERSVDMTLRENTGWLGRMMSALRRE